MNKNTRIAKELVKLAKMMVASDWSGSTTCDICHKEIKDYLYDAQTVYGSWATLCKKCWEKNTGHRLGTGSGQEYVETKEGDFSYNQGGSKPNQHLKPYSMNNNETSGNPFAQMLNKLKALTFDGSNKSESSENGLDFECYRSFQTMEERDASTEMEVKASFKGNKYNLSIWISSMGYWDNRFDLTKIFDTVEELKEFVMNYDFDGEMDKSEQAVCDKDEKHSLGMEDEDDEDDNEFYAGLLVDHVVDDVHDKFAYNVNGIDVSFEGNNLVFSSDEYFDVKSVVNSDGFKNEYNKCVQRCCEFVNDTVDYGFDQDDELIELERKKLHDGRLVPDKFVIRIDERVNSVSVDKRAFLDGEYFEG